jgi:hypothetical protein
MTFLHDDKIVPDRIGEEMPAPACPRCGSEMWLVLFSKTASDDGTDGSYTYECKNCGAATTIDKPHIAS